MFGVTRASVLVGIVLHTYGDFHMCVESAKYIALNGKRDVAVWYVLPLGRTFPPYGIDIKYHLPQ